jgi:hypothetical protein
VQAFSPADWPWSWSSPVLLERLPPRPCQITGTSAQDRTALAPHDPAVGQADQPPVAERAELLDQLLEVIAVAGSSTRAEGMLPALDPTEEHDVSVGKLVSAGDVQGLVQTPR